MAIRVADRGTEVAEGRGRIGDKNSAEYDDAAARAESRGSSGSIAGCLLLIIAIVLPAFLYFGLFAVLMGEETLIGSGWFRENLPASVLEFLRAIYLPLLWLMDQFDG